MFVSGPGKKRRFAGLSRREFLQYSQGAALPFLPCGLGWPRSGSALFPQDSSLPPEFHVHPVYRTPRAIEAVLKKARAEYDTFPTEIYQDQIARILQAWSAELRVSPQKADVLEHVMGGDFAATSPAPGLQARRNDEGILQVWEAKFPEAPLIGREAFLAEWRAAVRSFSKLLTVEFQVTGIHAGTKLPAGQNARVGGH